MKIVWIENCYKTKPEDIEIHINKRSFKKDRSTDNTCRILFIFTNKKTNTQTALVEVTAKIYKTFKRKFS